MATTLPPWLQINPEQFTQAAIAGGQQGYQAAGQAASLAQEGLLNAAKLAQDAASRAAEIAVRREQINAELASNSARVYAAQAEAAAQNAIRQQQVDLARVAEQNQQAEIAATLASREKMGAEELASAERIANLRASTPQTFAPSDIKRLEDEAVAAEAAGNPQLAKLLRSRANVLSSGPQPRVRVGDPAMGEPVFTGTPEQVAEYQRTRTPAGPAGTNTLGISFQDFLRWRK